MINVVQMGFGLPTNMEDMEAMVYGDDDDDDLEAELAALTGEASSKKASPVKKGIYSLINSNISNNIFTCNSSNKLITDIDIYQYLHSEATGKKRLPYKSTKSHLRSSGEYSRTYRFMLKINNIWRVLWKKIVCAD